jgi:hypothetical protein
VPDVRLVASPPAAPEPLVRALRGAVQHEAETVAAAPVRAILGQRRGAEPVQGKLVPTAAAILLTRVIGVHPGRQAAP